MQDSDLELARQLQEDFDREAATNISSSFQRNVPTQSSLPSIVDRSWELTDPNPDIRELFLQYNEHFFWGRLSGIEIRWSPRMTSCAGLCVYEGRGGLCSVRLSLPLLKLRPRKDLVETLLHEMIHAYLFVTDNNKDHDGHGPEFKKHMDRINKETGTKISVYHSFHDEVAEYKQHWWKCNGPCQSRHPYFGYVKRSMNRAPSANDLWWGDHQRTCGGSYTKVKEPEGYGQKKEKGKKDGSTKEKDKPDIRSFLGSGQGSKVTSGKKPPPSSTATSSSKSGDIYDNDKQFPRHSTISTHNMVNEKSSDAALNRSNNPVSRDGDNYKNSKDKQNTKSQPSENVDGRDLPKLNWRPVLGNSRIPSRTEGVKIQTIWDTGKSSSDNSDRESGKPSSKTFQSQGQVLGTQGQGTSFLAQLRREINQNRSQVKSGSSSKTVSKNEKLPNDDNIKVDSYPFDKNAIVNHKHKVTKDATPGKTKHGKTRTSPSNSGNIEEWFRSDSSKKVPKTCVNNNGSLHSTPSPKMDQSNGFGLRFRSGSDTSDSIWEDDDFTSPRKPLFKKVNPASNFTSSPQKRISLYNTASSYTPSASASKGDNSSGGGDGAKNKHSTHSGLDSNSNDGKRGGKFTSWTRRPQYSTSDDSDVEEILPPFKRFKGGNKDNGKSIKLKHPDEVFQKIKKKNYKKDGVKGKTLITNKRNDKKEKDLKGSDHRARGDNSSDQGARGGNSSDQPCPVCQTMVPVSQINSHLDQCLTFD